MQLKRQICLRFACDNNDNEAFKKAIKIGVGATIEIAKVEAQSASHEELVERAESQLNTFLTGVLSTLPNYDRQAVSPVLKKAFKTILYGLIASGIFELVKLFSALEPQTFTSLHELMHNFTRDYAQEKGLLRRLSDVGIPSQVSENVLQALIDGLEYPVIFSRDFDSSHVIRDWAKDLGAQVAQLEQQGHNFTLEKLLLADVEAFTYRINWALVLEQFTTFDVDNGFRFKRDAYAEFNFVLSLAFSYARELPRIIFTLDLIGNAVASPNTKDEIYREALDQMETPAQLLPKT